jgi:hypothetical protein
MSAPSNLVAVAVSGEQIDLSWTDNATNETGFRIERCAGAGCSNFAETATVPANAVRYADTALTATTSYSYRVRAYNGADASTYSTTATIATRAADRLSDLGLDRLSEIQIEISNGRTLLRFTSVIVNVGQGPFEVRGQRASTTDASMSMTQRIYDAVGGWRDVPKSAVMQYSGDGHDHWHVRALETSELFTPDGSALVRGHKQGFCFWDNAEHRLDLPGAPVLPVYRRAGCGDHTALTVAMGLSIGWGDAYAFTLGDQYVDITGVADGPYRLVVTADPVNWFRESNETNNLTWVDLELRNGGHEVNVLAYGPSAVISRASARAKERN